jgi:prevent-host-death family protein
MSSYSVAEAKNKLSQLIKRAVDGEDVVITSHGQPIVELKPVKSAPRPMTDADFQRLRKLRARLPVSKTDSVTEVRRMREEGEV